MTTLSQTLHAAGQHLQASTVPWQVLLGDLLVAESCHAQDVADRYPAHAPLLAIAAEYVAATVAPASVPQMAGAVVEATASSNGKEARRIFLRRPIAPHYEPAPWVASQDICDRMFFYDDDLRHIRVIYDPTPAEAQHRNGHGRSS